MISRSHGLFDGFCLQNMHSSSVLNTVDKFVSENTLVGIAWHLQGVKATK